MADRFITALVSLLAIVGYLAFGFLLLTGQIQPHVAGDVALTLTGAVFGALTFAFAASVHFWVGSSFGSRSKDGLIGQLANPSQGGNSVPQRPSDPTNPSPQPSPASGGGTTSKPPAPPAPPSPAPKKFTVTATVFSEDEADNAQVAYPDVKPGWSKRPGVALPAHFHGARPHVQVWGPAGTAVCEIFDVGPWYDGRSGWPEDAYWITGARPRAETDSRAKSHAGIDLTPAAAAAIGVDGKGKVDWAFVDRLSTTNSTQNIPRIIPSGSEPPWLTLARAEIGFRELPDNHGIQRYVDLAGYGADGEPWCSIFAAAMLRKAGIDISGANAMARSWTTAPCVTQVEIPQPGDLAVFWRGSKAGSQGHVGFYISEDAAHVQVLGGNESDQVEIAPMAKAASAFGLLGYWRPKSEVT